MSTECTPGMTQVQVAGVCYEIPSQVADEIRRRSNGLSCIHNEIPTNWLDSLLTGPGRVDLSRCDNKQIEELLRRLKERVRLEAEKWLIRDSDRSDLSESEELIDFDQSPSVVNNHYDPAEDPNYASDMPDADNQEPDYEGFAMAIIGDFPEMGSLDGFDIQEMGEKYGLLIPHEVYKPCGEHCQCEEFHSADEMMNGVTCYRKAWVATSQERDDG